MNAKTHHIINAVTCLATAGALMLPASAADRSLAEFDGPGDTNLSWQVVNDGVMGGRSKGQFEITDSGTLRFRGNLSLENNGGFSSLRTSKTDLDLSDSSGIVMRVKGDGRTYQLRLGSDARYRGMEVSFMAEFPTEKGEWREVQVPFSELTGTFRGRTLKDKTFNPAEVRRFGLLLADKQTGPFNLEVDWVRAIGGGASNTVVDLAIADGRFKTLATALQKAQLAGLLQGEGPFTVFAPTDGAFAQLPTGTVARLLEPENLNELQAILKYHVSPGSTKLAGALKAGTAATAQGGTVTIAFEKGDVRVNSAAILDADIEGSNGIIHVIDSVLLPPESCSQADCSEQEASASPKAMIEEVIDRGVPVFNNGKHEECADIYKMCLDALASDSRVDESARKLLARVIARADATDCMTKRAWVYRGALDALYAHLDDPSE